MLGATSGLAAGSLTVGMLPKSEVHLPYPAQMVHLMNYLTVGAVVDAEGVAYVLTERVQTPGTEADKVLRGQGTDTAEKDEPLEETGEQELGEQQAGDAVHVLTDRDFGPGH